MKYKHNQRSSQNLFKFFRTPRFIVLLIIAVLIIVMSMCAYIASIDDVNFKFIFKLLDVFEVETHLIRS